MIAGYKLQTNTCFGLPPDPFRYEPENNRFPMILDMARKQVASALNMWIAAKMDLARDFDEDINLEADYLVARLEVMGLTRMFLGCIEDLYFHERRKELVAYANSTTS